MKKRTIKIIFPTVLTFMVLLLSTDPLFAGPFTPLPGDGTSEEWCDVTSFLDTDSRDNAIEETLRHRIELYNKPASRGGLCFFYIFFTFKDREITLSKPLTFEKMLRDRDADPIRETVTGTYISGYGTGGVHDKLNITIDALRLTQDHSKCAFVIKGGFSAKQQIHGLSILVKTAGQAVCDDEGHDLMEAVSSNCEGQRTGKDCDFSDVLILTPETGVTPVATAPTTPPTSTPVSPTETHPATPPSNSSSPVQPPTIPTAPTAPAAAPTTPPAATPPSASPTSPTSAPSASPATPSASPSASSGGHDESFHCQMSHGTSHGMPSFLVMMGLPLAFIRFRKLTSFFNKEK